jgi:prevent-host-death family protein
MAITDFKARCLAVLEEVARTADAVTVTRRGKPLARVVPALQTAVLSSPQSQLRGTLHVVADDLRSVFPAHEWDMNRDEPVAAPKRVRRQGTKLP